MERHLKIKNRHLFIYCNTATRAVGTVRMCCVDLLAKLGIAADVLCFNGQCGDFEKAFFMELLTLNKNNPQLNQQEHAYLLKWVPLICTLTNAADMGIDDQQCGLVAIDGFCSDMYGYAQRFGRAGRVPLPAGCTVPYECLMVVTLASFCYLARRNIMDSTPEQHDFYKARLHEILEFAVLQTGCLYAKLESFFGNPEKKKEERRAKKKEQAQEGRQKRGRRKRNQSKKARPAIVEDIAPSATSDCCAGSEGIGGGKCSYCFPTAGEEQLNVNVAALVRELRLTVFDKTDQIGPLVAANILWKHKKGANLFMPVTGQRRIFKADIELLILQMIAAKILSYQVVTVPLGKKNVLSVRISVIITQLGDGGTKCQAFEDAERWNGIGEYNLVTR